MHDTSGLGTLIFVGISQSPLFSMGQEFYQAGLEFVVHGECHREKPSSRNCGLRSVRVVLSRHIGPQDPVSRRVTW
jgi:hypothetical protein